MAQNMRKVQFLNIKDMIKELEQFIKKPLIRIQNLKYCLNTKEHGIPIHNFEVKVTTLVKDEIWCYIEPCGSAIAFDDKDYLNLVGKTKEIEKDIRKLFEDKNFETAKGIYLEEEK